MFKAEEPQGPRRIGTNLAEINIIPLVDVVLVLLLIFMLTAPMMYRGIDVNLPKAASKPTAVEERMVLTVTKDQSLFLNEKRVPPTGLARHPRPPPLCRVAGSWRRWTASVARASSDSEWSPSRLGSAETATAVPAGALRMQFHIGPALARLRLPLGPAFFSAILHVILLAVVMFGASMWSDQRPKPVYVVLAPATAARGVPRGVTMPPPPRRAPAHDPARRDVPRALPARDLPARDLPARDLPARDSTGLPDRKSL